MPHLTSQANWSAWLPVRKRTVAGDRAAAERQRDARLQQLLERQLGHPESRHRLVARESEVGEQSLVAGVEPHQIVDRHHDRQFLLHDRVQKRVVFIELGHVHAEIDAGVDAGAHAVAAVRVARDLQPHPVRLVDDRLHLLERQRRRGDERAVRLELVQSAADEILRRVDLDPVDAVQLGLAHGGASQPRPVDVLVFRVAGIEAGRRGSDRACSPAD